MCCARAAYNNALKGRRAKRAPLTRTLYAWKLRMERWSHRIKSARFVER